MTDSTNPIYQKGFRAGRKLTAAEVDTYERTQPYNARWNACYLALLPTAMTVHGWTMGQTSVHTAEQRIDLAKIWADLAVRKIK